MICHDIILFLLNPDCAVTQIEEFLTSDSTILQPCEVKLLEEILKIGNQYKEIKSFIFKYSFLCSGESLKLINENSEENLAKGLYLQAFCDGVDEVLRPFRLAVGDIESRFLQTPTFTLMFIYHELSKFSFLFSLILRLISGIKTQRLHGCTILQFLHEKSLNGNSQLSRAVLDIQKFVYVVFFKQLTQWLLYGKFTDTHIEFFIQHVDNKNVTQTGSEKTGTHHTATTLSDSTSINTELWRYEICYEMLPHYLSPSWAEKVLFIGQTIVMFNSDVRSSSNGNEIWCDEETVFFKGSLLGDREYEFFQQFQDLMSARSFHLPKLELIVDDIKKCVAQQLSDTCINEADLVNQLKLIKDFYLLGRGELFLEFVRQISSISKKVITDSTMGDVNRAFQLSANSINISDQIEQFSFMITKESVDSFNYETLGFINFLTLKYKVKWPLHLLFSPKVLEKYNEIFRFFLRIKKTQYDLQMVWCHHRECKIKSSSELVQFRNKLMFLVDNLQYYLQVDVLESQFSILLSTIQNTKDFDHIQRAHTLFQANILSFCFLMYTTKDLGNTTTKTQNESMLMPENPVLTILNNILQVTDNFCLLSLSHRGPITGNDKESFEYWEKLFSSHVDSLLKMLTGLKAGPTSGPLSQLLLRLDFNHWFSGLTI